MNEPPRGPYERYQPQSSNDQPAQGPSGQPAYGHYEQAAQPRFIPDPQGAGYSQPGYGQGPYSQGGYPPQGGYPYQPQQGWGPPPPPEPPRKKRHWVRNIFAGIGALVVLIIIIAVVTSNGGGVSTKPSGSSSRPAAKPSSSASASKPATAAGIGSYFDVKDSSGDTYRVTLEKIIDPAQGADQFTTPDAGNRFVGAVFTIKAISGSPQDEDADSDAVIVGSNGQSYTADFSSISGYTNFSNGEIRVAQGESSTGAVTFQVPEGVKVAKVQWTPGGLVGTAVQWNVG